jgi:homoserine kinase type II
MALLTPMSLAEARALGEQYAVTVISLQPLAAGSVNSNFRLETRERGSLFMRVYEEPGDAGARAELGLVRELAPLGVPTPLPLTRVDGGYTGEHRGRPVGMYPWVAGEILCQARVTPSAAQKLGSALARLHQSSSRLSSIPSGRFDTRSLFTRLDHIERSSSTFADQARAIRRRIEDEQARVSPKTPRGIIHGDLFRDNVLWQDGEIAALIDFESASAGTFVYDLMVCVHAWCYGDEFRIELVRALFAGSESVRPLSAEEVDALSVEGALAALRFATTRITDYAMRAAPGERPGRDYERFLARLAALDAGALSEVFAPIRARVRAGCPPEPKKGEV